MGKDKGKIFLSRVSPGSCSQALSGRQTSWSIDYDIVQNNSKDWWCFIRITPSCSAPYETDEYNVMIKCGEKATISMLKLISEETAVMETCQSQNRNHIYFLLKIVFGLSALRAIVLLCLIKSDIDYVHPSSNSSLLMNMTNPLQVVNNRVQPKGENSSMNLTNPLLLPQQLVDLKDFQFTINNDICGRGAISIAHWVVFFATFWRDDDSSEILSKMQLC